MSRFSDVQYLGKRIGEAQISKNGLYYLIECKCTFPDEKIYRITALCGENRISLGVCIPIGNAFGLITRVPIRRIGEGEIRLLAERKEEENRRFISVFQDAPFPFLEKLDNAVLQGGEIWIKDPTQVPQDSDQNQEHPKIWE